MDWNEFDKIECESSGLGTEWDPFQGIYVEIQNFEHSEYLKYWNEQIDDCSEEEDRELAEVAASVEWYNEQQDMERINGLIQNHMENGNKVYNIFKKWDEVPESIRNKAEQILMHRVKTGFGPTEKEILNNLYYFECLIKIANIMLSLFDENSSNQP